MSLFRDLDSLGDYLVRLGDGFRLILPHKHTGCDAALKVILNLKLLLRWKHSIKD